MKYRIVLRLLGLLLVLESLAMALCGVVGYTEKVEGNGMHLFFSAAITVIVGLLCMFVLGKKPEHLPKREGLILVGLTWVVFGVFGAIPYMLGGSQMSFADAIFESVSGFSATGATVIQDLSLWPDDILLWRATTQWLGGLGILVLFMALLSSLGAGTKFLFRNESSFETSELTAVKIKDIAYLLLLIYMIFTTVCALGLKVFGMSWFEAITHSFTTVSTAGFSIYNESVGHFRDWDTAWLIECWLILFMMLAAFSFVFYLILWRKKYDKALKMEEILIYVLIVLVGFFVMLFAEFPYIEGNDYGTWIRRSLFMTVSISTTTGYGLVPEREWPVFIIPALTILMLIGGCSGSTAGGMKVSRMIALWRITKQSLTKAFRPHQYMAQKVNGKTLTPDAANLIILFIALNFSILFLSATVVAIFEHRSEIDFETAFSAAVTCMSNVGPGFGEIGFWGNFSNLNGGTKIFLSLIMVLGRLELFTLLALLSPNTWKRF